MKLTAIAAVALLGAVAPQATAEGKRDCPHPYRPKSPPKRPPPPKKNPPPTPCECKGEKGDQGPPGPKGDDGSVIVNVKHEVQIVRAEPAIRLGVGVMGTVQAPHGDWAWGPALQLSTDISERYELAFSAGLAAIADSGRESGLLAELKLSRDITQDLKVFGGLYFVGIDGSPDNGEIDGNYLGATLGLSADAGPFRLAAGPTIGGLRDDSELGNQFVLGIQGSAFVRFGQ